MSKKNRGTDRTARAAAAVQEQQREERRRRNFMVGGVVVALLVVVLGGFFLARALDTTSNVSAPTAGSDVGLTIGSADAPHTVVVYEDFLCPYCGEFEKASRDDLAQLAADGKVQVEYRPFDLLGGGDPSSYSVRAASAFSIVLATSGPEVAKKFHDLLYENQPSESGPFPDSSALADLAVEAGAKEADVRDAIEADQGIDWVTKATAAATKAGVQGTPTVLVDGKVVTDFSDMQDLASTVVDKVS